MQDTQDYILGGLLALVAAICLGGLFGCGGPPEPPDLSGPRPHLVELKEGHAGRVITVCSGDRVMIEMPCVGDVCYRCTAGVPHMMHVGNHDHGRFEFRAGAPGQCMVRFTGPKTLEFHFEVVP